MKRVNVGIKRHRVSNHTRNRVREQGPIFEVLKNPMVPSFDPRKRLHVLLLSSKSNRLGGRWCGWLPICEITMENM
jgi:hypothetical protein